MFSYAGTYLADPEGHDPGAWIAENIRPAELFPLAARLWPGTLTGGPVLDATPDLQRPVEIGCLWWPWGASRFAHAHFVVGDAQLAAIRSVVFRGGAESAAELVMDDGDVQVRTDLWMLPPRPLAQVGTGGMWLLTLVDDRYWWAGEPLELTTADCAAGWLHLYATIGAALGVTIDADPIASAYGTVAPAAYASLYRPLPQVLDAIAFSVGQRIVRRLDGTVHAQNWKTAKTSVAAQLAAAGPKYAGGSFALTTPDQAGLVPESVEIVYPGDGAYPRDRYAVASILATLALPEYAGPPATVGTPWTRTLHRYEVAIYGAAATPVNAAALASLTIQAATDWYDWQLAALDQQFAGLEDWTPEGLHNIEWRQARGRIVTRVARGVYNPLEDLVPVPTPPPPAVPCIEPPVSFTSVCQMPCVNGKLLQYLQTVFISCAGTAVTDCVFDSYQGCCQCDTHCGCCTPDNPCPWWLCLCWPAGYCNQGPTGSGSVPPGCCASTCTPLNAVFDGALAFLGVVQLTQTSTDNWDSGTFAAGTCTACRVQVNCVSSQYLLTVLVGSEQTQYVSPALTVLNCDPLHLTSGESSYLWGGSDCSPRGIFKVDIQCANVRLFGPDGVQPPNSAFAAGGCLEIPLLIDFPAAGTAANVNCTWCDASGTLCFSKTATGYQLVFNPGNEFGCATYSNTAPWDCQSQYTVFFQSSSSGADCNNCGNWPPALVLTPSPALPFDANPCNDISGSGSASGTGPAVVVCCSPTCPTPTEWEVTYHLRQCPTTNSTSDWCAPCTQSATPNQIDIMFSGMTGVFACFNGTWSVFPDSELLTGENCSWQNSVGPGSPGCSIDITLVGAIPTNGWEVQLNTAGKDVAVYLQTPGPPNFTGNCCMPYTFGLSFASAPGAPPLITIDPICGEGNRANVDCSCIVKMGLTDNCCWTGKISGIVGGNKGTNQLCLVQNADGSYSWVLDVFVDGALVAVYASNVGFNLPCCCDDLILPLVHTKCLGFSPLAFVKALNVDCGSGSGSGTPTGSGSGGTPQPNLCCSVYTSEIFLDVTLTCAVRGDNTTLPLTWDGTKYFLSGAWSPPTACSGTFLFRVWNNTGASPHCELDYSCDGGATWHEIEWLDSSTCTPFEQDYGTTTVDAACGTCATCVWSAFVTL